jgi:hypothetical protein
MPYRYSITHYTFCIYIVSKLHIYLKNNINVKYTIFYVCPQAHNPQPILPDHAQQVPKNTPEPVFSKLISTVTIKDIVKPEIDDIAWAVAAFCKC